MSEDTRSSKRRRVSSKLDPPTPTKQRLATPRNATSSVNTKQRKSSTLARETNGSDVGNTPQKHAALRAATALNSTTANSKELEAREASDESNEESAEDSDPEPRRSGRERKPSAKLKWISGEVGKAVKADNRKSEGTTSSAKGSKGGDRLSEPRPRQSKVKPPANANTIVPKKRGRPPKAPILPEPESSEAEPLEPDSPIQDTPRKRGRPPKKRLERENEAEQPNSTAKIVPKATPKEISKTKTLNGYTGKTTEPVIGATILAQEELPMQSNEAQNELIKSAVSLLKCFPEGQFPFTKLLSLVTEKLTQRRPIPLTHLEDEYSKVYSLLEATVTAGEGNSMLVVGARGSGKSALVNKALKELAKDQKDHFHVVKLSGFIQTDDKIALREIWRQLGKEMEVDEEASKSYADTLTMLLALLSHPEEITGEAVDGVAKSVVFVMDEFDLFATHARQTLLYNLLDIAQSRKAPIAVLGLTTKFDVTERLEKRVKSRFSHRYVHLPLPKSLFAFKDICEAALTIHSEELSFDEQVAISQTIQTPQKRKNGNWETSDCLAAWNESVKILMSSGEFINAYIKPVYHLSKSVPTVLSSLVIPLNTLFTPEGYFKPLFPTEHFLSYKPDIPLLAPTSTLALLLPSLSELQLSLLIAAARLDIIHSTDTCSFGMAYAEYVSLAGTARMQNSAAGALATGAGARVWGRDVAKGEWEALVRLGLLVPVSESAVTSVGALVKIDVRLEEIPGAVPGISSMMEKWCTQL
ncbi:hypothetical protein BT63DRAFT_443036 [Microthyrium microscopicum]|uniref:Origin recognition complex subunit 4 n=1 Tax=Microthyrium microscopicum TaxID=703497 RepID=A0A6A6U193_9PEZI|nr:hypothetical protein BT63DRAFT_443036 [Microthyrium microscopicum]